MANKSTRPGFPKSDEPVVKATQRKLVLPGGSPLAGLRALKATISDALEPIRVQSVQATQTPHTTLTPMLGMTIIERIPGQPRKGYQIQIGAREYNRCQMTYVFANFDVITSPSGKLDWLVPKGKLAFPTKGAAKKAMTGLQADGVQIHVQSKA